MTTLFDTTQGATMSECGKYRWHLFRTFSGKDYGKIGCVLWIMLNPSTADADKDDPTIRRCCGFAKSWGYSSIAVVNLFAYRATDPREIASVVDPVGRLNDQSIKDASRAAGIIIAAWGAHGKHRGRDQQVIDLVTQIKPLHCLGLTNEGRPRHPLYVRGDTQPIEFAPLLPDKTAAKGGQ